MIEARRLWEKRGVLNVLRKFHTTTCEGTRRSSITRLRNIRVCEIKREMTWQSGKVQTKSS